MIGSFPGRTIFYLRVIGSWPSRTRSAYNQIPAETSSDNNITAEKNREGHNCNTTAPRKEAQIKTLLANFVACMWVILDILTADLQMCSVYHQFFCPIEILISLRLLWFLFFFLVFVFHTKLSFSHFIICCTEYNNKIRPHLLPEPEMRAALFMYLH